MKKFLATTLLLLCLSVALAVVPAFAQEPVPQPAPEQTLLWTVIGWLLYSILGLVASVTQDQKFDARKFARSFLWLVIVAVLAIGMKINPSQISTQNATIVEQIVDVLMNSSVGLTLIYFLDKLYLIIINVSKKLAPPPT